MLNYFQGYIRHIMFEKLEREGPSDPLPPSAPPEIAAPTPNSFFLRWEESEKSQFNATAARIVTDQVCEDWPGIFNYITFDEIFDMVSLHIKYLIRTYREQNDPNAVPKEELRRRRCNADTRKRTVSISCSDIVRQ